MIVRVGLRGVAHGGPVHVAFYALCTLPSPSGSIPNADARAAAAIATTWLALALFAPQTEDSGPVRKTRPPVHQDPRYVAAVLLAAQLPALVRCLLGGMCTVLMGLRCVQVVCALPRARDPNGAPSLTHR